MQKKLGKNKFLDDFEGVFEKKISRFNWAKCHIKLNHAIYILYPILYYTNYHIIKKQISVNMS